MIPPIPVLITSCENRYLHSPSPFLDASYNQHWTGMTRKWVITTALTVDTEKEVIPGEKQSRYPISDMARAPILLRKDITGRGDPAPI